MEREQCFLFVDVFSCLNVLKTGEDHAISGTVRPG